MADEHMQAPGASPQASEEHVRRQYRAASFAMLATAVFVIAIIGFVGLLGNIASQRPTGSDDKTTEQIAPITDPFYVLLIGSDSRRGTALYTGKDNEQGQVSAYADIITLMRVDPQTYTVTLVTIPRDTVVQGDKVKINDALSSGEPTRVVEAVNRLTGVYADYYAMVTFASFENFIDAIGGVDVDVPRTVTVVDPMSAEKVTVKAGEDRHLDGAEALVFARARKEYDSDQDALRQVNVRSLEQAIITKVLNLGSELDVGEVLDAFDESTATNLDLAQIGALVMDFVRHKELVKIYSATGPYKGAERKGDGQWVVQDNSDAWERIMSLTDAGFDPSGVVKAPTFEESDAANAPKEQKESTSKTTEKTTSSSKK